jgi:hypothetical protein
MTCFFDKDFPWDVTEYVRKYQAFLNSSWPYLDNLMKYHDWDNDVSLIDDYVQSNWEILIEREILGKNRYLTPLSVPMIHRVTQVGSKASHSIVTKIPSGAKAQHSGKLVSEGTILRLFGFCTALKGEGFGWYPPFDFVNLVLDPKKEIFIVPLSELTFYLVELDNSLMR